MQKSIIEFTEEYCYETLEKACWKNGIFCYPCKSKGIMKDGTDESTIGVKVRRYKCKQCKNTFTVKTNTIFENTKVP
ncbi:MAG: hypothetical protein BWK75_05785, partial [Candidatus Altiarchaeales archaeon A3]